MLALWIGRALVVTAVAALGAHCAERALQLLRCPTRYVWLFAMLAATGMLAATPILAGRSSATRSAVPVGEPTSGTAARAESVAVGRTAAVFRPWSRVTLPPSLTKQLRDADRVLAALWCLGSLSILVLFCGGTSRLQRTRRAWHPALVDGVTVWVSDDVGPAVVGLRRPHIVVPAWVLELDVTRRTLLLRHEAEHIRAGDPKALAVAGLLILLMPWNAPLWVMVARLRAAIELDCDRRVLRSIRDVRAYGALLIEVAARTRAGLEVSLGPALTLSTTGSGLARRITALAAHAPRLVSAPVTAYLALAAGAFSTTAAVPAPRLAAPATVGSSADAPPPALGERATPLPQRPTVPRVAQLRAHAERLHPELFAARPKPATIVALILDERHRVIRHTTAPRHTDGYPVGRAIRELIPDLAEAPQLLSGIAELRLPPTPKRPGDALDLPVQGSVWVVWAQLRSAGSSGP